jgi:deoxyribodipyrimidine photolyase-like uncharacterized protein
MEKIWHICSDCGYGEIATKQLNLTEVKDYFKEIGCTSCWREFIHHVYDEKEEFYTFRNYTIVPNSKFLETHWHRDMSLAEKC